MVLIGGIAAVPPQQPSTCEYFTETRHYVCDDFLTFYKTRGDAAIFGYPITEAFLDPDRGIQVQYFQNVRMELHPQNPAPYRVLLGLLIDELGYNFPRARAEQIPRSNSPLHHYFPETGHVVSYSFLDYFREKGGLDIFGYPRSEFMFEDGHIVQYFQRARMEWRPEITSGPQMQLAPLGEWYTERFGIPGNYADPLPPPDTYDSPTPVPELVVTKLNISASVRYVITGREGGQTVFVYVTDQWQQPVSGASVQMTVHYPAGDQPYRFNELTNDSGFSAQYFDIQPAAPGQKVVISVIVTHGELTGTTQTFFLPWW